MRFGGHQTFHIRDGWLPKALRILLSDTPEILSDTYASDQLGVGNNMVKSIYHWLLATKLAYREQGEGKRLSKVLAPTDLSRAVYESDPYCALPETWWALHLNLIHHREHAETWYWFFNNFGLERFDRGLALRRLEKHIETDAGGNTPQTKTLERDFGILLSSYATDLPSKATDPEEDNWCPFRQLELLTFYSQSNSYQVHRRHRSIPSGIMMYAIETTLAVNGVESEDIRFFELSRLPGNPIRAFLLPTDAFFEQLLLMSQQLPESDFQLTGLAGDRQIRMRRQPAHSWIERAYKERAA